jgi:putative FmdB family regulatory protein
MMPFYEYSCESCQAEFETFVKTMTDAKPVCPKCGGKKVARKMSVFGVSAPESHPAPAGGCGSCHQSGTCPMAQ